MLQIILVMLRTRWCCNVFILLGNFMLIYWGWEILTKRISCLIRWEISIKNNLTSLRKHYFKWITWRDHVFVPTAYCWANSLEHPVIVVDLLVLKGWNCFEILGSSALPLVVRSYLHHAFSPLFTLLWPFAVSPAGHMYVCMYVFFEDQSAPVTIWRTSNVYFDGCPGSCLILAGVGRSIFGSGTMLVLILLSPWLLVGTRSFCEVVLHFDMKVGLKTTCSSIELENICGLSRWLCFELQKIIGIILWIIRH